MKTFIFLALVGFAAAECPNACSGHGTCGAKDSCSCYQNYQGNDCSERTCYFGIAHVDTPKGDLNADGMVSGPLTTVITGSEVYPWGTTEQYPNADANEGHFYMECSNKGICDRKTGTCDCFDGYEGTACVRASCPNDCSGHGTCETIKELAEMKSFDTTAGHAPSTTPVGATTSGTTGSHDFDLAIEESYAYDLWDQDKTMGCKCDPVYFGADCSLKKCKYGVDPLFYDDTDGRIYQTTVIHLGSKGVSAKGKISGTFSIVFYDVFGEKYATKGIQADPAETTALKVQQALEALPNGVIAKTHGDVTFEASGYGITKTPAVQVSKADSDGTLTTSGCIGAGTANNGMGIGAGDPVLSTNGKGVGLGVLGYGATSAYGPEFTITFSTNPGILKTIELDTRQVTNPGTTDYWVANSRQGQFQSRYSTNLGRINTLRYGSKLLYTNTDLGTGTSPAVTATTPLKVGGQEFGVATATDYVITLSEPFLGTSIIPVLTDTGSMATALKSAALEMVTSAGGKITALTVGDFKSGAKLYVNGCPITSSDTAVSPNDLTVTIESNNDCHYDAFPNAANGDVVYRRTDDPNNQNVYATSGDVSKESVQGYCTTRGSADIYACAAAGAGVVKKFVKSTNTFTFDAAGSSAADNTIFVNHLGPMRVTSIATTDLVASYAGEAADEFFETFDGAAATGMLVYKATAYTDRAAGDILIMDGRRYKVASIGSTPDGTAAKVTLTESYAGGMIYEECTGCVTAIDAGGITLTVSRSVTVAVGEGFMVQGYTDINQVFTAKAAVSPAATSITLNKGGTNGYPLLHPGAGISGQTKNLYKVLNGMGYKPFEVTEAVGGTTYQYVSQCSNRGACDSSTGVCKCFKGYSNDNCDTQNMLAA